MKKFNFGKMKFGEPVNNVQRFANDIQIVFKLIDPEGDGFITIEKLRKANEDLELELSEEDMQMMIKEADPSGTGRVDLSEVQTMFVQGRVAMEEQQKLKNNIKDAFEWFDTGTKGYLKVSDFPMALRIANVNPTPKDVRRMLRRLGYPRRISYQQFRRLTLDASRIENKRIVAAFQCFDPYSSGYIRTGKLRQILQPAICSDFKKKDMEQIISDFDDNGLIKLEVFVAHLTGQEEYLNATLPDLRKTALVWESPSLSTASGTSQQSVQTSSLQDTLHSHTVTSPSKPTSSIQSEQLFLTTASNRDLPLDKQETNDMTTSNNFENQSVKSNTSVSFETHVSENRRAITVEKQTDQDNKVLNLNSSSSSFKKSLEQEETELESHKTVSTINLSQTVIEKHKDKEKTDLSLQSVHSMSFKPNLTSSAKHQELSNSVLSLQLPQLSLRSPLQEMVTTSNKKQTKSRSKTQMTGNSCLEKDENCDTTDDNQSRQSTSRTITAYKTNQSGGNTNDPNTQRTLSSIKTSSRTDAKLRDSNKTATSVQPLPSLSTSLRTIKDNNNTALNRPNLNSFSKPTTEMIPLNNNSSNRKRRKKTKQQRASRGKSATDKTCFKEQLSQTSVIETNSNFEINDEVNSKIAGSTLTQQDRKRSLISMQSKTSSTTQLGSTSNSSFRKKQTLKSAISQRSQKKSYLDMHFARSSSEPLPLLATERTEKFDTSRSLPDKQLMPEPFTMTDNKRQYVYDRQTLGLITHRTKQKVVRQESVN